MSAERKRLEKKLDAIVSKIVRKRDKVCVCCKKFRVEFNDNDDPITGNAGHFISRKYKSIRWNLKNVNLQCPSCNVIHNINPVPYTNYMLETYGQDVIDDLNKRSREYHKLTIPYLQHLLNCMTIYYKEML